MEDYGRPITFHAVIADYLFRCLHYPHQYGRAGKAFNGLSEEDLETV